MLPVDVIVKIVFFIPDPVDVFALLDTFRPYIALGPLGDLYQLGLTHDHSSNWPTLTLDCSMDDALLQSIAKLYSSVLVDDSWYSVEWLKKHLNPMTTIEWMAGEFPVTLENMDDWADLRITRLYLSNDVDTPPTWRKILPRLHHLKSLRIDDPSDDLREVYETVAMSSHITELEVNPAGAHIGNEEIRHLIEWFHRQPVRVYDDSFMTWAKLGYDLKQKLCEAMFNCPTLDRLTLTSCDLEGMDFSKFSFSMNTLQLHDICFWDDVLSCLASRLKDSMLTHLELDCSLLVGGISELNYMESFYYTYGVECILNVMPLTSIKSLDITGCQVSVDAWCSLIPRIFPPNCQLERFTTDLIFDLAHPTIVQALATSIQSNHTLSFHLLQSKISIPDMRLLIQSISDPSRQVKTKRIKWTTMKGDMEDESTLKSLEEFAIECGCEFVHESCK